MNRHEMLEWCKRSPDIWDLIIIGGGATGLGSAVDAASRGYRTLLLEQSDFAKGTSSRSTKLIHGGLRYLKQGNVSLVIEALKERGLLRQNAPHLVKSLGFLVPTSHWWEAPLYRVGLKIYDLLAGKLGLEKSHWMSRKAVILRLPTLKSTDIRGGVLYHDGQFDDARLAITLVQTATDLGAAVINYMPVVSLIKKNGLIQGVEAVDLETNTHYALHAKAVINATGVFADTVRKMDNQSTAPLIAPSQGIHLVLDRSFLPSDVAILIPKTEDKRVLFFIPWYRHLIIGTTDTSVKEISLEPHALSSEIDFLLNYAGKYLTRTPTRSDIRSVFAGLRPLVQSNHTENTSSLSREHAILVSESNLITICGGKWTTYRRMAQDVIDKAAEIGTLEKQPCRTQTLHLHGYKAGHPSHSMDAWTSYGTDAAKIEQIIEEHPTYGHLLHPDLPYILAEVIWAIRGEMARTVEDVLARRTRSLFLDARASLAVAPRVATLMAKEMGRSPAWEQEQCQAFANVANNYLP